MHNIAKLYTIDIFVTKKTRKVLLVTLSTIVYSALLVFASFVVGVVFISYVAYKSKSEE